ncbi:MAG: serine hydrolase domain-containing protein [Pseudomonadota bacterium]
MFRLVFAIALLTAVGAARLVSADELAQGLAAELLSRTGAPGVAVAYHRDGAEGLAVAGVRALGSDTPIEPEDLWHLGSNTKSMTATLVARLDEAGEIGWDATIGETLGATLPEMDPAYRNVTIRQLLAHRSGLPANLGVLQVLPLVGMAADRDLIADRLSYARATLSRPPESTPGTDYLYSNAGYIVVGAMLEAATGTPWETLMAREVFGPLGLTSAGFGPPGTVDALDQPRGHQGTIADGLTPMEPNERADNVPALGPAGTVHMSASDLLAYLVAHLNADPSFLSPASWTALHSPEDGHDYVAGWLALSEGTLLHTGSNTFWYMLVVLWPDRGEALMLAANAGDIAALDPAFGEVAWQFAEGG